MFSNVGSGDSMDEIEEFEVPSESDLKLKAKACLERIQVDFDKQTMEFRKISSHFERHQNNLNQVKRLQDKINREEIWFLKYVLIQVGLFVLVAYFSAKNKMSSTAEALSHWKAAFQYDEPSIQTNIEAVWEVTSLSTFLTHWNYGNQVRGLVRSLSAIKLWSRNQNGKFNLLILLQYQDKIHPSWWRTPVDMTQTINSRNFIIERLIWVTDLIIMGTENGSVLKKELNWNDTLNIHYKYLKKKFFCEQNWDDVRFMNETPDNIRDFNVWFKKIRGCSEIYRRIDVFHFVYEKVREDFKPIENFEPVLGAAELSMLASASPKDSEHSVSPEDIEQNFFGVGSCSLKRKHQTQSDDEQQNDPDEEVISIPEESLPSRPNRKKIRSLKFDLADIKDAIENACHSLDISEEKVQVLIKKVSEDLIG